MNTQWPNLKKAVLYIALYEWLDVATDRDFKFTLTKVQAGEQPVCEVLPE